MNMGSYLFCAVIAFALGVASNMVFQQRSFQKEYNEVYDQFIDFQISGKLDLWSKDGIVHVGHGSTDGRTFGEPLSKLAQYANPPYYASEIQIHKMRKSFVKSYKRKQLDQEEQIMNKLLGLEDS